MRLVIVESPTKSKTIMKYLGNGYHVLSSRGHIRDLSISGVENLGVDIQNDFQATYEVSPGKEKLIEYLKKEVEKAEEVYLATDPDREGEAISWHLADVLNLDVQNTKRLEFHEITSRAIKEAFDNPRHINMDLVSSQETRRILDRIIGFKLSTLMQKKIHSKSAGRVQSVVLKLIVDREKEIQNFKEEAYYQIHGCAIINGIPLDISYINEKKEIVKLKSLEEAKKIIKQLEKQEFTIDSITVEEKKQASLPVYTTSTLQQDAYNLFKFDSKKTMKIAQSLYEGVDLGNGNVGLITYMRTDSVRISPLFISLAKKQILEVYGEEYVGVAKIGNRSNNKVQDAHEGIRPTDITLTPESIQNKLTKDQEKLYRMIYYRAIASMMKEEIYEKTEVILTSQGYQFLTSGEKTLFVGFKKAYQNLKKDTRKSLPVSIKKDTKIEKVELELKNLKTQPPYRYNEARLIQTMENLGIGRPSTYATTLDTIKARDYVRLEKGYYKPSLQGIITTEKLAAYFSDIINVEYTSKMESELDDIAEGKLTKSTALHKFYPLFEKTVKDAYKNMPMENVPMEDYGNCPECGQPLVLRRSRYGTFVACSGYPNCHYILEKEGKECPECHQGVLVKKRGKFGNFYACSNYPKCKHSEK